MKKLRALTASILASAMAMSMTAGFAALAAEGEPSGSSTTGETTLAKYKVTIENISGDKAKHTYEAYQIFTGSKVGTDFEVTGWGNGVELANLKLDNIEGFGDVTVNATADSAKAVAAALTDSNVEAFADAVGDALSEVKTQSSAAGNMLTDIGVNEDGYYLIKDSKDSVKGDHSAKTRYILTMADELKITAKSDFPTIEKNIIEDNKEKKANSAAIGDVVTYQLKSYVPDMTGYNKYFYIVNDSMFEGLTLDKSTINVKVDGVEIPANQFYYKDVADTKPGYDDFEIVFVDFLQYIEKKGAPITVTYNATLNENAKVGIEGNPNIVDLTFSNDPNYNYTGNVDSDPETPDYPDEPKPSEPDVPGTPEDESKPAEPTGKTPPSEVITYTTGIELIKIDKTTGDRLTGAEFSIEGNGINWIVKKSKTFTADANGTYYKLKDGTYTDEAPDGNEDSYADTETKYILTETADVLNKDTREILVKNLAVDSEGVLKIDGLNAGTYKITETTAPTGGYIKKTDPITVTIGIVKDNDGNIVVTGTNCEWTYSGGENGKETEDGTYTFNFSNVKGVVLPGTGAFGSKLMYALGTIFTGAGAAYMISKKKSKKEEE